MKNIASFLIAIILIISISSCNQKQESTSTDKKFEETKEIAKDRNDELFGIFNGELSEKETAYIFILKQNRKYYP